MFEAILNQPFNELRIDYQLLIYFGVIALGVLITHLVNKFLNNKSHEYVKRFIFIILILGLIVHFIKPFFHPYLEMDYPLKKLTFENICAVSILTFPLIYYSKNDTLKDYMVIIGIVSGILSFLVPIVVFNQKVLSFEFFRFYFVHFVIFLAPYLMAQQNIHKVSIKRVNRLPLVLLAVLFIIFINELIITALGWEPVENLFDPTKRNPSLIYGVGKLPEAIPEVFERFTVILTVLTPDFLMNVPFLPEGAFVPVIWMIVPAFVYGIPISVLVLWFLEKEETEAYFKKILIKDSKTSEDGY